MHEHKIIVRHRPDFNPDDSIENLNARRETLIENIPPLLSHLPARLRTPLHLDSSYLDEVNHDFQNYIQNQERLRLACCGNAFVNVCFSLLIIGFPAGAGAFISFSNDVSKAGHYAAVGLGIGVFLFVLAVIKYLKFPNHCTAGNLFFPIFSVERVRVAQLLRNLNTMKNKLSEIIKLDAQITRLNAGNQDPITDPEAQPAATPTP